MQRDERNTCTIRFWGGEQFYPNSREIIACSREVGRSSEKLTYARALDGRAKAMVPGWVAVGSTRPHTGQVLLHLERDAV